MTTPIAAVTFTAPVAEFLLILPILLFSVVAHEYAHAWTAYRQGDPTAHSLGRLTLNPIPHIDPIMSIVVPIGLFLMTASSGHPFTFGAAKPVPVNPRNYRNYRRGDILVSSAGIVMNWLIAFACAGVFVLVGAIGHAAPSQDWLEVVQRIAGYGITINLLLAVFNLVPVPPLDGSHLFYHVLPPALGARYRALGRYGFAILLVLLYFSPVASRVILWPAEHLTEAAGNLLQPWDLSPTP